MALWGSLAVIAGTGGAAFFFYWRRRRQQSPQLQLEGTHTDASNREPDAVVESSSEEELNELSDRGWGTTDDEGPGSRSSESIQSSDPEQALQLFTNVNSSELHDSQPSGGPSTEVFEEDPLKWNGEVAEEGTEMEGAINAVEPQDDTVTVNVGVEDVVTGVLPQTTINGSSDSSEIQQQEPQSIDEQPLGVELHAEATIVAGMKEENDVETPTERAIDVEVSGSRSDMEGSQQLLNKSDDVQPSSRRPHVASLQEESPLESLCQPEKDSEDELLRGYEETKDFLHGVQEQVKVFSPSLDESGPHTQENDAWQTEVNTSPQGHVPSYTGGKDTPQQSDRF